MNRAPLRSWLLYSILFLSGLAGLGYQMAWLRMFAPGLGHEMPAALAVVCAFMGGMALGAWSLDRKISRSQHPGHWYASLEIIIGLWGFLSLVLIPLATQAALQTIGLEPSAKRHWTIAFLLPFLSLLPATFAMGATFPAMERFVAPWALNGRCVGGIYAANTLGAVAGTLGSAFFIVPQLGLRSSICCFAGINLICGVSSLALANRQKKLGPVNQSGGVSEPTRQFSMRSHHLLSRASKRLALTIFCTGLLGIGYETVEIRVLSEVLENTVYSFAAVLSVFLFGTSLGAAIYQRLRRSPAGPFFLTDLLCGLSFTALLGALVLSLAQGLYDALRHGFGDSACGVLAAEMAVAVCVSILPTVFMGAIFSHLVQSARRAEGGVGKAAALNTFGAAVAPALFGVMLLPALGSKWTLASIGLAYLVLVPGVGGFRWAFLSAPFLLLLFLPQNLHHVQLPPGGKLTEYREGVMDSVAVLQDAAGERTLRVNNRFQMGGTAAADAEYRHAHIPLLLHPAPGRALFLGLGTGITFGAASLHPHLESDGVELLPEVVAVMTQFEPQNYVPNHQPSLKVHIADARRFVRVTQTRYDVIVGDLFHPARDGAGSLYTLEHFQAVRERLAPGGLFFQWLPLHQLDEQMLRIIVRTFLDVFPEAQAWLLRFNVDAPVIGLAGTLNSIPYSSQWIEHKLGEPSLEKQMKKLALADSIRFFGHLLAGPRELREFAGHAPLNTDDQPRIVFGAPQFTYQRNAKTYGRLMTLLSYPPANLGSALALLPDAGSNQFAKRLTDYIKARDVYLKGLVEEGEGHQAQALEAFIESARLSEEFTPGYAQCLTIASLEAKANPQGARALLRRLVEAQPSRPIAAEMLKRLRSD